MLIRLRVVVFSFGPDTYFGSSALPKTGLKTTRTTAVGQAIRNLTVVGRQRKEYQRTLTVSDKSDVNFPITLYTQACTRNMLYSVYTRTTAAAYHAHVSNLLYIEYTPHNSRPASRFGRRTRALRETHMGIFFFFGSHTLSHAIQPYRGVCFLVLVRLPHIPDTHYTRSVQKIPELSFPKIDELYYRQCRINRMLIF